MPNTKYVINAAAFDKRGVLLSLASNSYTKTHPLQAHFAKLVGEDEKIYLHAEIAAMIKAGADVDIEFIRVIRVNGKGEERYAKPCKICQQAAKAFGVKRFIYSTGEGKKDVLEI